MLKVDEVPQELLQGGEGRLQSCKKNRVKIGGQRLEVGPEVGGFGKGQVGVASTRSVGHQTTVGWLRGHRGWAYWSRSVAVRRDHCSGVAGGTEKPRERRKRLR